MNAALTWATMLYYGRHGYEKATKAIVDTTRKIRRELESIHGIRIMGTSEVSVVAIGSDKFNAYALMDAMHERGWTLNSLQYPPSFHIAVTLQHTKAGVAEQFIDDIKQCTRVLISTPPGKDTATASIYGMSASVPDRRIVAEFTKLFLDACYATSQPDFAGTKNDDNHASKGGHVSNGTSTPHGNDVKKGTKK